MSGIYIHVPFCKKACHYCNFHFSTQLDLKSNLIKAITKEVEMQSSYLDNDKIQTIYFGGGTPSLLNAEELDSILQSLAKYHSIDSDAEITLEANPDDLNKNKLFQLKKSGINRLSIGVQSFYEEDLLWMNRSHNAQQALSCITEAQDVGLDDISIDLIFGCPTSNNEIWINNIEKTQSLDIPHISCYGLTVEPNTALEKMIKLGKMAAPQETDYASQFVETMNLLKSMSYDHYEISNYAKEGKISQHNTNYWRQEKYLGLGPAAHSFNGSSRQWNVSNNPKYISQINDGSIPFEKETLSVKDIFNEYLMTGLRTKWGCQKSRLNELPGAIFANLKSQLDSWIDKEMIFEKEDCFVLTQSGKLLADQIISSLFIDEL